MGSEDEKLSRVACPKCGNTAVQLEEASVMCWSIKQEEFEDPYLCDDPELYTTQDVPSLNLQFVEHGQAYRLACYGDAHKSQHTWAAPDWVVRRLLSSR